MKAATRSTLGEPSLAVAVGAGLLIRLALFHLPVLERLASTLERRPELSTPISSFMAGEWGKPSALAEAFSHADVGSNCSQGGSPSAFPAPILARHASQALPEWLPPSPADPLGSTRTAPDWDHPRRAALCLFPPMDGRRRALGPCACRHFSSQATVHEDDARHAKGQRKGRH